MVNTALSSSVRLVTTSTLTRLTIEDQQYAYNFTGISLFTGCGQSLASTTRGSQTRHVINF